MKKKTQIADKTYHTYLTYYLERGQLPDEVEQYKNHRRLYQSVLVLAPNVAFEGFEKLCQKCVFGYEGRI